MAMNNLWISPDQTLYEALGNSIKKYSRRPALSTDRQNLTFEELGRNIDALGFSLGRLGVKAGDKVAIILQNCPEFVYAFFAPSALGAAIVPLNPLLRQKELLHILGESEASVVIADVHVKGNDVKRILESIRPSLPKLKHILLREAAAPGFLSLAEALAAKENFSPGKVSPDDLFGLLYTSGTTGIPKAVMHSHRTVLSAAAHYPVTSKIPIRRKVKNLVQLTSQYGGRYLRWSFGKMTMLPLAPFSAIQGCGPMAVGLLIGFRIVIPEAFHPGSVLELVDKEHVNFLYAPPTAMAALLESRELGHHDYSSLLGITLSSSFCPPGLVRRARKAFGCMVYITFGTTESTGSTLRTTPQDPEDAQSETIGRPLSEAEIKIVDEQRREVPRGEIGELAQRFPGTMLGYFKAPELTAQTVDKEGWHYTGDLAAMDERGYVRIVGRKKDMIIRGGQNVYPAEIERHLLEHPNVQNAAVVGVPHPIAGEFIWAFIVPKEDTVLAPIDIFAHCRGGLAPFKVPDEVRVVDRLPLNALGKVQKFLLREMALQEKA
jgi:fatty-acyl-CoA synthase